MKIQESKKIDKYLDLIWELKKLECEGDSYTNCSWYTQNALKRFGKKTWGIRNEKNWNHPDDSIAKIG